MMQLLFLAASAVGSLHVLPNHVHVPHTCTIQIHRNSVNGWWECNSTWKTVLSFSNTTNRTCIGPHSLTSDYYIQRKQNQYIFKEYLFIYLTLVGLSCGSWDLHCVTQDVLSWHGVSGVCSLCLCCAWAYSSISCGILYPHVISEAAISEAPEAKAGVCPAFMKDWTRSSLCCKADSKLEFLRPPGMSCEKSVIWTSYLHSYNQYFFIHNNHLL